MLVLHMGTGRWEVEERVQGDVPGAGLLHCSQAPRPQSHREGFLASFVPSEAARPLRSPPKQG